MTTTMMTTTATTTPTTTTTRASHRPVCLGKNVTTKRRIGAIISSSSSSPNRRNASANAASSSSSKSGMSSSSSPSSNGRSNDFDDRVEEASIAVQRAEAIAAAAEAKLQALDMKLSSSNSGDEDEEEERGKGDKTSSRVQELKKSLEEMKQANLELRKKKSKAASSSSSSSSSPTPSASSSASSTPVSRLAAMEREEEEEKIRGIANNADVDTANNFGGGSQRRLYDQMLTLRTRLNERVASSNAFAKYLEKTLLTRDDDLKRANELLYGAAKESGELLRLIRDAQNDIAKSGDDPTRRARGEQKLEKFVNRLQLVESTLTKNAKEIDSTVVRTVPLEYHGIASDVIMMGDFDGWTRGIQLYPSFVEGGSSTFTGEARLAPGSYLVKFKVDGEWRLAREWPSSGEGFDANNVLTVM
jgi:hypothetical protein